MPKPVYRDGPTTNGNGKHRGGSSGYTKEDNERFAANELVKRFEVLNQLGIVNNALLGRSNFLELLDGNERDINNEVKYPETSQITVDLLKEMYDRESVANRVVQVMPMESWATSPDIIEDEDADSDTEFEQAWKELSLALVGESKFKRKEGSPVWEYLKRGDVLSGIGYFGVIFLGLNDGQKDLAQPARKREGQKLLFMRAFDQSSVTIAKYETDMKNPRFGLPVSYNIDFASTDESIGGGLGAGVGASIAKGSTAQGVTQITKEVHWSRVIHLADNIGSNEVFGIPRMRPVYNRLIDLRKLYAGSAEMYWKGAFPGLSLETHPSLGGSFTIDTTALKENLQNYMEGLQRYLTLSGMAAKSLAPQVVDPSPQIETQIDAICIQLGIPKRVFLGSERGELASSQDRDTWNARVEARQAGYLTPRVIVPFIDRLIDLGVLPEPQQYHVIWPDLDALTEEERASIAIKKIHTLTKYVSGDVEAIMSPVDFYTRILDMDEEEATAILEKAIEAFEESEERDLARDIMEAKALKKHSRPQITSADKQMLLEFDEAEKTAKDAKSDKFTGGAEEKKKTNKLTSVRAGGASDALKKLEEEDELL